MIRPKTINNEILNHACCWIASFILALLTGFNRLSLEAGALMGHILFSTLLILTSDSNYPFKGLVNPPPRSGEGIIGMHFVCQSVSLSVRP